MAGNRVILDAAVPNPACLEKKPGCVVSTSFHIQQENGAIDPNRYTILLTPGEGDSYSLASATPNDPVSALSLSTFQRSFKDVQEQKAWLQKQAAVLNSMRLLSWVQADPLQDPLQRRLINFFVAGEIAHPDPVQQKAMADLLKEVFSLSPENQVWIQQMLKGFQMSRIQDHLDSGVAERIRWFEKAIEDYKAFHQIFKGVSATVTVPTFKEQAQAWSQEVFIYLVSGAGDLQSVFSSLKEMVRTMSHYKDKLNLSKFFGQVLVGELRKLSFPKQGLENFLVRFSGELKSALVENFCLPLEELFPILFVGALQAASQAQVQSIKPSQEIEVDGVRFRVDNTLVQTLANFSVYHSHPDKRAAQAEEIANILLPYMKFLPRDGIVATLQINDTETFSIDTMIEAIEDLSRADRIFAFVVLRYVFGADFNGTRRFSIMTPGGVLSIHFKLTPAEIKKMEALEADLLKDVLGTRSGEQENYERYAFIAAGIIGAAIAGVGAGTGSEDLTCFGSAAGAAAVTGLGFQFFIDDTKVESDGLRLGIHLGAAAVGGAGGYLLCNRLYSLTHEEAAPIPMMMKPPVRENTPNIDPTCIPGEPGCGL